MAFTHQHRCNISAFISSKRYISCNVNWPRRDMWGCTATAISTSCRPRNARQTERGSKYTVHRTHLQKKANRYLHVSSRKPLTTIEKEPGDGWKEVINVVEGGLAT